ncbi:hypothetical protein HDV03_000906 [Kappamyces sp. JEL0829]|nr:hypothetical protein HDV03_000906 [Kappamyces sp. JEL0829]
MVKKSIDAASTRSSSRLEAKGIPKAAPKPKVEKKTALPKAPLDKAVPVETVGTAVVAKEASAKWQIGKQISAIVLQNQDEKEINLAQVAQESGFVDKAFKLIGAVGSRTSEGRITRSHVVVAKGGTVLDIAKSSPKESVPMALATISSQ